MTDKVTDALAKFDAILKKARGQIDLISQTSALRRRDIIAKYQAKIDQSAALLAQAVKDEINSV